MEDYIWSWLFVLNPINSADYPCRNCLSHVLTLCRAACHAHGAASGQQAATNLLAAPKHLLQPDPLAPYAGNCIGLQSDRNERPPQPAQA